MNKPKFYEDVMQKEEPPFHFKIHLFIRNKDKHQMSTRELSLSLMEHLGVYGATKIRENQMNEDKIRFLFEVPDKDKAIACYSDICAHTKKMNSGGYGEGETPPIPE